MMILADPNMEGRDTVVRHLMEVDSESPWPPDYQLEFTTLWCRSGKVIYRGGQRVPLAARLPARVHHPLVQVRKGHL
jgi:hypothetical protein